jgi:hypothetical protein
MSAAKNRLANQPPQRCNEFSVLFQRQTALAKGLMPDVCYRAVMPQFEERHA